jgi:uncharacterized protein (TIGR02677 family)
MMDDTAASADRSLRVFTYAVVEKVDLYVSVVEVLVDAKERFSLQLRPGEVAQHLPDVAVGDIAEALETLEGWGNVTKFYDTAAPETLDEFYAKRFLYQLTEAGVAAHRGIQAVRRVGLDTGRLSSVLLPGIIERLIAIRNEAAGGGGDAVGGSPDGARLYRLLVDLFGAFTELADNAARYMNDLAVETTSITNDDESFLAYKRAVFVYLDEFVARLVDTVPQIATVIAELNPDMEDLMELAADADAAPTPDGDDDGVRRSFQIRWIGVQAWFVHRDEEPPIADSLRLAMLDALNRILAAVGRLHERHLRRVTREADFTQLARWFATATPDEAPLLWDRAFGLYSSRHFTELAGDEDVERGRSFWDAEPAQVAPRLRASGARSSPGRPGRAADYSTAKVAGLARLRAQHEQAAMAVTRLARRTPIRLSDLGTLDPDEFAQFLTIIDAALSARPARDGSRTASTPLVSVTLRPVPGASGAVITTPAGRLACVDLRLEVDLAGRARVEAVG